MIVIICGLPGVGKSTLAKSLAPLIDAVILSTDKIRKELFSEPTYQRAERKLIYDVMILLAKYLHKEGKNCILDATFNLEKSRREIKEKIQLSKKELCIVECNCPEILVLSRLDVRKNTYSDADSSIYKKMKKIYEPVQQRHIDVDTSKHPKENAKMITKIISSY